MTDRDQKQLGKTLWNIADQLRGAMNADDFRDYMLSFLFLRYLSDNYEQAARKELGKDYPDPNAIGNGGRTPLSVWYADNPKDVVAFEKQMRLKVHYVIKPEHLWASISHMAKTQNGELLNTLQAGFKYIENESFQSRFQGLFSEINLGSDKLGRKYEERNAKLCGTIADRILKGLVKRKKKANDFDILAAVDLTCLSEKDVDTTTKICQEFRASGIALAFLGPRVVPIPPFRRPYRHVMEELRGRHTPLGRIGSVEESRELQSSQ